MPNDKLTQDTAKPLTRDMSDVNMLIEYLGRTLADHCGGPPLFQDAFDRLRPVLEAGPELLEACREALKCFRAIYDDIESGSLSAEQLLASNDYWPLSQLRDAILKAKPKGTHNAQS